jgi:PAS domain-containing protein
MKTLRKLFMNCARKLAVAVRRRPACFSPAAGASPIPSPRDARGASPTACAQPDALYQALRKICNARNPEELFLETCRVAVEKGGFASACVGVAAGKGEFCNIQSYYGRPPAFPKQLPIPKEGQAQSPRGSPTGGSEEAEEWCDDLEGSAEEEGWRTAASAAGFRAGTALPLGMEGPAWGWLFLLEVGSRALAREERAFCHRLTAAVSCAFEKRRHEQHGRELEERLHRQQEQFDKLARMISGILYQFRVRNDGTTYYSYISPSAAGYGLPTDPSHPHWQLGRHIHPDDRDHFLATVARSIMQRTDFHFEGRAVLPDGSLKWIRVSGALSVQGEELVYDGVATDITAEREAKPASSTTVAESLTLASHV